MASVNSVFLVGRLVKDPEVRTTKNDKMVCSFTMAVDKSYGREGADFIDCETWGKTAEFMGKYLKKGRLVLASGRLEKQVWEKDGQKQSRMLVVANEVNALDYKKQDEVKEEEKIDSSREGSQAIDLESIPF